jgi:prepilin signal peptidase PulO-like enzyme (type II secretory pathway)
MTSSSQVSGLKVNTPESSVARCRGVRILDNELSCSAAPLATKVVSIARMVNVVYPTCNPEYADTWPCNASIGHVLSIAVVAVGVAFVMCIYLTYNISTFEQGNETMIKLSATISKGARSFLVTEYKYLAVFVFVLSIILLLMFTFSSSRVDDYDGLRVVLCFVSGAVLSAAAGWGKCILGEI